MEGCTANPEAVARYTRVTFLRVPKDLIDAAHEFGPRECDYIALKITVGCDGVIDIQFVLYKMFVDGVNGIQRSFLTRDPDIISSRFLSFGPWQVQVAGPIFGGGFCYVSKSCVAL